MFLRKVAACWKVRKNSQSCRRSLLSTVNGFSGHKKSDSHSSKEEGEWMKGEVLDLAADLRTFRPGDKLDIPYELTVSETMQDFWQSVRDVATRFRCC